MFVLCYEFSRAFLLLLSQCFAYVLFSRHLEKFRIILFFPPYICAAHRTERTHTHTQESIKTFLYWLWGWCCAA